jgi:putative ABC transport system ATP-binding protein
VIARLSTMTGATVELTGVRKTFVAGRSRVTAIDDVTLRFAAGSMTAITGASGSGKSTLLHLIGAIESADAGSIRVDDLELTRLGRAQLTAYRRSVGFVFQRYHLLPALSALDNVIAPVLPYRVGFDKTARACRRSCRAASSSASRSPGP